MKKWMIISCIFLILIFAGIGTYAYQTVRSPLNALFEKAEQYARSELTDIVDIDYYHGEKAYIVVTGFSQEMEKMIMFILDDFSSHHMEKASDGITEDQALEIVKENVTSREIQSIRLGIEKGLPIYEVIYKTENQNLGYYYLTFKDGTFMKKYQLRID